MASAGSTSNKSLFIEFVALYTMAMTVLALLVSAVGGRASYFAVVALLSCLACLSKERALQIVAVVATSLAIICSAIDHEQGRHVDRGLLLQLERRLRECEEKLSHQAATGVDYSEGDRICRLLN
jgi:hypothetical protein